MTSTVRWNLAVSQRTDQALRVFLAHQRGHKKGDLSRFVEEAVCIHIFELSAEQAKSANKNISEVDLLAMIEESVDWARDKS